MCPFRQEKLYASNYYYGCVGNDNTTNNNNEDGDDDDEYDANIVCGGGAGGIGDNRAIIKNLNNNYNIINANIQQQQKHHNDHNDTNTNNTNKHCNSGIININYCSSSSSSSSNNNNNNNPNSDNNINTIVNDTFNNNRSHQLRSDRNVLNTNITATTTAANINTNSSNNNIIITTDDATVSNNRNSNSDIMDTFGDELTCTSHLLRRPQVTTPANTVNATNGTINDSDNSSAGDDDGGGGIVATAANTDDDTDVLSSAVVLATDNDYELVPHSKPKMSPISMDNGSDPPNPSNVFNSHANSQQRGRHLAIPEIIEMLKNLAACQEKQFKWEQSARQLSQFSDSDPNKLQLLSIIDLVENTKSSPKEKAIYLYEQLGHKCHQHKNYIGAAKAFERAASLRFDITELDESGEKIKEEIVSSTIRNLESAIVNYDAIHKYKHAGTLHYRCSRILRLINAPHQEVERHHVKALEYFTKPDHELKQRKRIDGLKISCYSSYSTWARMTQLHNEIEKFTTTTTTNTIKFHSDGCYRDSDDSDSNHSDNSPTPPPVPTRHMDSLKNKNLRINFSRNRDISSAQSDDFIENLFHSMPNEDDSGSYGGIFGSMPNTPTSLGPSIDDQHHNNSSTKTNSTSTKHHREHHYQQHNHHHHESSSTSSASSSTSSTKDNGHSAGGNHHVAKSSHSHHRHTSSSYSYSHHHHKQQKSHSSASNCVAGGTVLSSGSSYHSHRETSGRDSVNSLVSNKGGYRCIEDRIESARKLVKKLHKLCPFYEVSTNGEDAGRVHCRICDRYLGAVSSTLKNHVNTQEHRQAYEDSQLGTPLVAYPIATLPSLGSNNALPQVAYPTNVAIGTSLNANINGGNRNPVELSLPAPSRQPANMPMHQQQQQQYIQTNGANQTMANGISLQYGQITPQSMMNTSTIDTKSPVANNNKSSYNGFDSVNDINGGPTSMDTANGWSGSGQTPFNTVPTTNSDINSQSQYMLSQTMNTGNTPMDQSGPNLNNNNANLNNMFSTINNSNFLNSPMIPLHKPNIMQSYANMAPFNSNHSANNNNNNSNISSNNNSNNIQNKPVLAYQ